MFYLWSELGHIKVKSDSLSTQVSRWESKLPAAGNAGPRLPGGSFGLDSSPGSPNSDSSCTELVLRRVPLERVGVSGPLPAARRSFRHRLGAHRSYFLRPPVAVPDVAPVKGAATAVFQMYLRLFRHWRWRRGIPPWAVWVSHLKGRNR